MSAKKSIDVFLEALAEWEDPAEDLHDMVTWITAGIKWVAGTNSGMGVLEANAVKQQEAIEHVGDAVGGALDNVATALNRIADEMMHARRSRETSRVSDDATS